VAVSRPRLPGRGAGGPGRPRVMAPTELLAEQHAEDLAAAGRRPAGLRLELLTASTAQGACRAVDPGAGPAAGELDVVLGTHALLAEAVGFAGLGLVVIDEQHRFGGRPGARSCATRATGRGAPHLLVMTANPDSRARLALTAYGDPRYVGARRAGRRVRTPVATRLVAGGTRHRGPLTS